MEDLRTKLNGLHYIPKMEIDDTRYEMYFTQLKEILSQTPDLYHNTTIQQLITVSLYIIKLKLERHRNHQ